MNIALPALVVFLLVLPGFVFRSRWKTIERTSIEYAPFGANVVSGLIVSALFHAIWLAAAYIFCSKVVDVRALFGLLSNEPKSLEYSIRNVDTFHWWILLYFTSMLLAAYLGAPLLRWLIMRKGWHVRPDHTLLRIFYFDNAPWYQLLRGQEVQEGEGLAKVFITAIVEVGKEPILYRGYLKSFHCNSDGSLDRLVLTDTHRRPYASSSDTPLLPGSIADDGFRPIKGDVFLLRYAETKTLNIGLLRFSPIAEEDEGVPMTLEDLEKLLAEDPIVNVEAGQSFVPISTSMHNQLDVPPGPTPPTPSSTPPPIP